MFLKRLKRFLRQFFHPGTWILFSLLAVGAAILFPPFAPALIIFAAVAIGVAAIAFIPYVASYLPVKAFNPIRFFTPSPDLKIFDNWWKAHPVQVAIVAIGVAAFITALVLTIGFFTGGAGFAFMAPVFAALAAPFAVAGASAGISLSLSALAGTALVLGVLNLTNTLKRFAAWIDSFKYDHAAALVGEDKYNRPWNIGERDRVVKENNINNASNYPAAVFKGMWATITNGFASPDADKLEYEPLKLERM